MIRRFSFTAIFFTIITLASYGQSEQLVINPNKTSLPGLFTFENPKGSIKVTGYDGEVILVTWKLRFRDENKPAGNGMQKVNKNDPDISAEVNGNAVTLLCRTTGKTVDFDIKVPRKSSLRLKSLDNGNVDIINIDGEIEIENTNGDITLKNITGSAVLSSVYGKISAGFREVDAVSPMMFTSFEGNIELVFPASVKAKLKMKSEKGEILSDFDIKPLSRKPVVKTIENTRVYSLEDWVVGSVNGGGPEYIIKSYNGNITIRKK